MHGAADVLHRGVADHAHDAEFDIDLDVADVRAEAALGAFGVELHAGADRPAHLRGFCGELGQGQRFELAGVGARRMRRAVFPFHRLGVDLPDLGGALAQGSDDLLGRLRHHHRGGKQHAAAAGQVREADGRGIADQDRHLPVVDAEQLGADVCNRRARAADIRMAGRDDDVAVLGDVDLG